jgi:organic hydroperoxide reductase OsmC/OhrA
MAEYVATITWNGTAAPEDFRKGKYSREHSWAFDGGVTVPASPAPTSVPLPWSNPANVDPEEAFVASISSCHMLTFLWVASKQGFCASSYVDRAVGVMTKNERGVPWVSKVTLNPAIQWVGDKHPTAAELDELHHAAHDGCYIAQSVKTDVVVAGT